MKLSRPLFLASRKPTAYPFPYSMERSHRSWLHNPADGKDYLDFHCGYGSNPIGHNNSDLVLRWARTPLSWIINKPACGDFDMKPYRDFVDTFQHAMVPDSFRNDKGEEAPLFFIDGGAAANDNAIKIAQDYKVQRTGDPEATRIMHLTGQFSGRSIGTMSLTNTDPHKIKRFATFTDWPRIPANDPVASVDACLREQGSKVAGMLIETIQCEGGDNHLDTDVLQSLQQLCHEHDVLFMVDEVQTGFGTTGKRWCFEHHDLQPDVVTFGKKSQQCGLFGGPRVNPVRGGEDDGCLLTPGRISSTWSGNLVDMIRSTYVMGIIRQQDLISNAAARGDQWLEGMMEVQSDYPNQVSNVRGRGLILAFDCEDEVERDVAINTLKDQYQLLALEGGEKTVRFRPNLAVTAEEIDQCVGRVADYMGTMDSYMQRFS